MSPGDCLRPPTFMFRPVRTRLLAELAGEASPAPKILSIVAPTGYGKTVLMSELHASRQAAGEHCFWIGLDDRDGNVERLMRALVAALPGRDSACHTMHGLLQGDESIRHRMDELIETLRRLPAPTTIFIDNLNSCIDQDLGSFCDALIFRTPAAIRFVWSSTADLAINIGRAKLEGLVRQVGLAELSLNAQETRELLGTELEARIGAAGIDAVLAQTEGWPAAVRMVQIILAGAESPPTLLETFSGSDEDVAALLNRQVLQGFPADLRHFLLCLGQLRSFSLDLCRHAIGDAGAERHLDFLLVRNVFVVPLDRNRKWYRLHGLFRQYLLGQADRSLAPAQRQDILRRAAQWCEHNGEWRDALDYALACGETAAASRILDRTATLFVRDRGDIELYIGWAERLEGQGIRIGWQAHFWYVWALIFHRRYESGRLQLERLAERLHQSQQAHSQTRADAVPADLPQRIDYLRICLDLLTDRLGDTYRAAEHWQPAANSSDYYNVGSIAGIRGICLASAFKFAQARQALREAHRILHEIGGAYPMGWIAMTHGTLWIYEGDFVRAREELTAGLSLTRQELGEDAVLCATLAFVNAKCAVEMGREDEAREMLRLGLRAAYSHGLVDAAACGFDAAVKLWQGGTDELISVPHLRKVASSYPPRLSLMLSCFLVQRLLRLGRMKEALAEAESIGLPVGGIRVAEPDSEALTTPRYRDLFAATAIDVLIATARHAEAEAMIAPEYRIAQAEGRAGRLVELGLARAAIAVQAGDRRLAAGELTRAVSLAARRGIVRPFRDSAAVVADLVNDTKPSSWSFALVAEREFFAQICGQLPIDNRLLREHLPISPTGNGAHLSPTQRETELLALINLGLSNQEIADYTGTTVGTIKWHLKNLYRKLGVPSRSAALARARAMNLLFG